ncbi:MAG: abortive infection family protein [Magnetococcales bacterium]|nr:abortive infection family protein [Magnetococcales bacterium]
MSIDLCPSIREMCGHWRDATMLQQTFQSLEKAIEEEDDACIDCSKAIVEVVCQLIIGEFDSPFHPSHPVRPKESNPHFGAWVSAAVRALKLGDVRHDRFQKLISQHHKLTTALGDMRNEAGPVSHGKDGFLTKLSTHHRRAAILSADAIITFLHQAYLDADPDLARTREPFERFQVKNSLVDSHVFFLDTQVTEENMLEVRLGLPSRDEILIRVEPSRLLFQLDRQAYIDVLDASESADEISGPEEPDVEEEVA